MTNDITVKQYINSPLVQGRIQEVLKDHAPQFIISLLSTINSNKKLSTCEPASLLNAAMTAASISLPINQNLGFAYIVPYRQKQEDKSYKWLAQFQMGYRGFIQLAQRSNQMKTINVAAVHDGEITHFDRLTGEITFDWLPAEERAKNDAVGYVGYIELINGFKKTLYMTISELKSHGKRYSQSMKRGYGLWTEDFDSMARKTLIKLLLSKYAPLTTDLQKAILADQAVIREDDKLDYVDNTPVLSEDIAKDKERARVVKHIKESIILKDLETCKDFITDVDTQELYDKKVKELSKKGEDK